MKNDFENHMKRCIELAKLSEGYVSPNPLVGAVVLDKEGNFAGEGRHEKYGKPHAEVNALKMAAENAFEGTLIVNLEPCSHFGKTPPCADLIIEKGLKRVVIGVKDPNPLVCLKGIQKLKDAKIEVITGVLENECKKLNEIFFKNQIQKKPFIAIKTAITTDGKIASKTGDSKWITQDFAREKVQELRRKYDAILTGSNTLKADNPSMTCRLENASNPARIVIDTNLRLSPDLKFFDNNAKVYIAIRDNIDTSAFEKEKPHVEFIKCPLNPKTQKPCLDFLCGELYKKGICSIMVEAGGILNGAMLKEGLVDKIYFFTAPKIIGDKDAKNWVEGFDVDKIDSALKLRFEEPKVLGEDILIEAYTCR